MTTRISAALLAGFLPCAAAQPASTPEPSALRATPTPDANASASASLAPTAEDERNGTRYFGLLRARDLSFFSLSHLDLRPAHAVVASPGGWGLEAQVAYQNTWSLSPEVERYLVGLPGRRELGAAEVAAIRALPGENYLIDAEIGLLDVTLHHKFSEHWGAYLTASAVSFSGGIGDSTIERFHDNFGFSSFGRPALARNRVNLVLDLRDAQRVDLGAPTHGGLLDPTLGGFRASPGGSRTSSRRTRPTSKRCSNSRSRTSTGR
jgi:hypothetical protein